MNLNRFLYILALSFCFTTSAKIFAQEKDKFTISKMKLDLENQIKGRINESTGPILNGRTNILNVEIELNQNIKKPTSSSKINNENTPLTKFNIDLNIEDIDTKATYMTEIKSVNINFFVKGITEEEKKTLETIIKSSIKSVTNSKLTLKISDYTFKPFKEIEKKKEITDIIITFLSETKLIFAIIFSAVIIGLFGKKSAHIRSDALTKNAEAVMEKDANESAEEGKVAKENNEIRQLESQAIDIQKNITNKITNEKLEDIELFSTLVDFRKDLSENPIEVSQKIKRWITIQTNESNNALKAIITIFTPDILKAVFENLTPTDRLKWNQSNQEIIGNPDLYLADKFIKDEILEELFIEMPSHDDETKEILSKVTPEIAIEIIKGNPITGSLFFNIMKSSFIKKVIELSDESVLSSLEESIGSYSEDFLNKEIKNLTSEISKLVTDEKVVNTPFISKVNSLILNTPPSKESFIFSSLVTYNDKDLLTNISNLYYPASLIKSAPENILKLILLNLKTIERVNLIATSEDALREKLLSSLGNETSKLKMIIEVELRELESNEEKLNSVKSKSDEIWNSFVSTFRAAYQMDPKVHKEMSPILMDWIESSITTKGTGTVKAAA